MLDANDLSRALDELGLTELSIEEALDTNGGSASGRTPIRDITCEEVAYMESA